MVTPEVHRGRGKARLPVDGHVPLSMRAREVASGAVIGASAQLRVVDAYGSSDIFVKCGYSPASSMKN